MEGQVAFHLKAGLKENSMEKEKIVSLGGVLRKSHLKFLDDQPRPLKGQVASHSRAGLEENPMKKEKESFIEEISRN